MTPTKEQPGSCHACKFGPATERSSSRPRVSRVPLPFLPQHAGRAGTGVEVNIRLHLVHPRHGTLECKLLLHAPQVVRDCSGSRGAVNSLARQSRARGVGAAAGEGAARAGRRPARIPCWDVATGATPPSANTSRRRPPPGTRAGAVTAAEYMRTRPEMGNESKPAARFHSFASRENIMLRMNGA